MLHDGLVITYEELPMEGVPKSRRAAFQNSKYSVIPLPL